MFTDRQLQTLRAVCDTLIPSLPAPENLSENARRLYARAASELHVAEFLDTALPEVIESAAQLQLKLFLDALDQPLVNSLFGHSRAFRLMTLPEQTEILVRWSESPIPMQRQAFQAIKRLAFFMFYTLPTDAYKNTGSYTNPNWAALGYNGPPKADPTDARPIQPLRFEHNDAVTLHCDAVIVGSGAGGGVVARQRREVDALDRADQPGGLPFLFDRTTSAQRLGAALGGAEVDLNILEPFGRQRHAGITAGLVGAHFGSHGSVRLAQANAAPVGHLLVTRTLNRESSTNRTGRTLPGLLLSASR